MKFKNLFRILILLFSAFIFAKIAIAQDFGTKEEALDLLERTENLLEVDRSILNLEDQYEVNKWIFHQKFS